MLACLKLLIIRGESKMKFQSNLDHDGKTVCKMGPMLSKKETRNLRIARLFVSWIHRSRRWRHQMETFSALLAICAGNSPVTGEFAAQRPVTRSFDVFFDLRLNKRLSKQWRGLVIWDAIAPIMTSLQWVGSPIKWPVRRHVSFRVTAGCLATPSRYFRAWLTSDQHDTEEGIASSSE